METITNEIRASSIIKCASEMFNEHISILKSPAVTYSVEKLKVDALIFTRMITEPGPNSPWYELISNPTGKDMCVIGMVKSMVELEAYLINCLLKLHLPKNRKNYIMALIHACVAFLVFLNGINGDIEKALQDFDIFSGASALYVGRCTRKKVTKKIMTIRKYIFIIIESQKIIIECQKEEEM